MPDLIHLLNFESQKLMMATPPSVKHWLKRRVDEVLLDPALSEAAVIKAMKQVQQALDLRLKSHPDAKNAMIGALIVYCVLLRNEVRAMVRLAHQPHARQESNSQLDHMNNMFRLASMLQPLLKQADALQIERLKDALRRIH